MVDVSFTRIIRIRGGRVLYFTDAFDAERVAATASKFLGRDFRQVFFLRKNGDRQPHFALAAPTGKPLTKADALFVLAAALWWTRKVGGVKRKKARLMFA